VFTNQFYIASIHGGAGRKPRNRNEFMDEITWNSLIASLPEPHVLQTWQWSKFKARYGWVADPQVWHDRQGEVQAAAMILTRSLPLPDFFRSSQVMYIPKGPLLRDWGDVDLRQQVITDLIANAMKNGSMFIKIDPEIRLGVGVPDHPNSEENQIGYTVASELTNHGWKLSSEQVQFRNTVIVDLSQSNDELLARMKQKTRYNIRLAKRKGVTVRVGSLSEIDLLYDMYAETSVRDKFVIRNRNYYRDVWETFIKSNMAMPLIAEVEGEPVAALIFFYFAGRAWYMYGMSRSIHREKMANYLLQWEAMRSAKELGCTEYDLWGAPDKFTNEDPLWGVYRFKEGLGGDVVRHLGAWDLPVRPFYYHIYTVILPRILGLMRSKRLSRTRDEIMKG
jgi:peptidoglycan pentaglycine glycine transferase (the first glycine)